MDKANVFSIKRIFVSSTFKDMDYERDYLKNVILPRLNKEMIQYNVIVELCDLRSGIAKKFQSEQEQENFILQSCFSSIKVTHPYFIALIGDRYGWIPPKLHIENLNQLFQSFGVEISSVINKSVTEVEILLGCLNNKISNKGIICFRDEKSYENMPDEIRRIYVEEDNRAKDSLASLKEVIRERYNLMGNKDLLIDYDLEWKNGKFVNLDTWGEKVYRILKNQIVSDISHDKIVNGRNSSVMDRFIFGKTYKSINLSIALYNKVTNGIIREYRKLIFAGMEGVGSSTFLCCHYLKVLSDNTNVLPIFYSLDANNVNRSFDNIIKYLTLETNKYVMQLYDTSPEYNPNDPLGSLKASINLIAHKEYHILIIIDSYDKIDQCSNIYHHSLRWVPENAAIIISVGLEWVNTFSEDVLVCPIFPLLNRTIAKDYIESMGYKDLDDDTINKILEPLYNADKESDDDCEYAHYKTPLWIKMLIELLVDLNHEDYSQIRAANKDYSNALKEYREQIVPAKPVFAEELFLKIVKKNVPTIGSLGLYMLLLLALSKNGLSEKTIRSVLNIDEIDFVKTFSKTFNKLSSYISFSHESEKWSFKYEICKRSLILGYKHVFEFKSVYKDLLKIILPYTLNEGKIQDDLFYFIVHSRDFDSLENVLQLDNMRIIKSGAEEVAEGLINKYDSDMYFAFCKDMINHGKNITESKILFVIRIFERLQDTGYLRPVIDKVKSISLAIIGSYAYSNHDFVIIFMDFCNLMTDIFIGEDMHEEARLTNSIALEYVSVFGGNSGNTTLDSLVKTTLKQQKALNNKSVGYINSNGYVEKKEHEFIADLLLRVDNLKENLNKQPSLNNKLKLISAYSDLALALCNTDFNFAFLYHAEAMSLIKEVLSKTSSTNVIRSCSSHLFSWCKKCIELDKPQMAEEVLRLVLAMDRNLLEKHRTKENLVNIITTLCNLTLCCSAEDNDSIKSYNRETLYYISQLISDDFDLCCSLWLKQANACKEKGAFYEAFFTYDTMGDELTQKGDFSYILLLIEVQINIAEVIFLDGDIEAGIYRMGYATQQIEEVKDVIYGDEYIELLNSLTERKNEILAKYAN